MTVEQSFTDPAVQRCPFALIDRLHAEAPVYRDPATGFFVVARYDDIAYVAAHPELFSNRTDVVLGSDQAPGAEEVARLYAENGHPRFHTLVTNDPPGHTHFRAIVEKVFAPSFVRKLEPYIRALAEELVDGFVRAGDIDMLAAYCIRLPMWVVSDQLGVPRDDWQRIKRWSDATMGLINPALPAEPRVALAKIHIELQNYLAEVRRRYLAQPEERYFSRLAHAEVEGQRLTEDEFVNVAEQLLVAGNETTTNGIAHAITALCRDPALADRLRADPDLVRAFVEEVLRLHAPSPHLYRTVLADVELSGIAIPKGSIVMISYLSGNYDPARYADAQAIDLDRPGIRNHLAFGRGIHFCVGNQLARAEMKIAIETLLARTKALAFAPGQPEPEIAPIFHVHAIESLHVRVTPA